MSRLWELTPDDKRGTFAVRTYRPNYLLPIHYTSSLSVPSSPTHPAQAGVGEGFQRTEAKFQISLRAKALEDFVLPGGDVWLAYSQVSIWQIYNHPESSPFRSSDYQPEAIYVVPLGDRGDGLRLPGGWRWRMVQLGATHQSNGQGGSLSRSWNRVWLGAGVEQGAVSLALRVHQRVRFAARDDNPDIQHYLGRGELLASYVSPGTAAARPWRTGSESQPRLAAARLELSGAPLAARRAALVRAGVHRLRRDAARLQPPPDERRRRGRAVPVLSRR